MLRLIWSCNSYVSHLLFTELSKHRFKIENKVLIEILVSYWHFDHAKFSESLSVTYLVVLNLALFLLEWKNLRHLNGITNCKIIAYKPHIVENLSTFYNTIYSNEFILHDRFSKMYSKIVIRLWWVDVLESSVTSYRMNSLTSSSFCALFEMVNFASF